MENRDFDVLGVGNAIVDVVAAIDDDLLAKNALRKGAMTLVDEAQADALFPLIGNGRRISGGSAANTLVGAASLGCRAAFIGKVKDDSAGHEFARDIRAAGVHFECTPNIEGPGTAKCLVFVSPDGERTMATYLGACQSLSEADVSVDLVERSSILYLEGYLWDPPAAKLAFLRAARIAHSAGNRVALSLSDPFCVDRYRDEFLKLLHDRDIDILFANQQELRSLFQSASLDAALVDLEKIGISAAVTKGEDGCVVLWNGARTSVAAAPIDDLVDTTGAGDLFAAGFLAGLSRRFEPDICAQLGALAASEAIQHYGARPLADLRELARKRGIPI